MYSNKNYTKSYILLRTWHIQINLNSLITVQKPIDTSYEEKSGQLWFGMKGLSV